MEPSADDAMDDTMGDPMGDTMDDTRAFHEVTDPDDRSEEEVAAELDDDAQLPHVPQLLLLQVRAHDARLPRRQQNRRHSK